TVPGRRVSSVRPAETAGRSDEGRRGIPRRDALAVLVVLPAHELEPAQLDECNGAVVVDVGLAGRPVDEVVDAQRDPGVPGRAVDEDVLDRELDLVGDEAVGERRAL